MPRISQQTLDELSSRIDMAALVSEYTELERNGANYKCLCPFHNDHKASCNIEVEKKLFHCFSCGAGGSYIDFYKDIEKVSFYDAVLALAKKAGVVVEYDGQNVPEIPKNTLKDEYTQLYTRIGVTYHYFLKENDSGKRALNYLKSRGITDEIIDAFQLGYSPKDRYFLKNFLKKKNYSNDFLTDSGLFSKKYPDVSFFSNRLMFPICNRHGQTIAFGGRILEGDAPKYINSSDLIQYKKGENLYAFNLAKQTIRSEKCVIICEGYMDVIAFHQAGVKNTVAPLGTALTEEQVRLLKAFCNTFYLCFDSDKAGQDATYKSILLCRKNDITVNIIQLKNAKDPAEILLNFGAENLTNYKNCVIIDNEYLLSVLMQRYPVNTPEGKMRICLDYFPYLDALNSDIHRESCFEYLCQMLNLSIDSVKEDYKNRDSAKKKLGYSEKGKDVIQVAIKLDAELRALVAVVANFDYFPIMRSSLSVEDFENVVAREVFITLEECFREGTVSCEGVLSRCSEEFKNTVTKSITSGEFANNSQQFIEDSVQMLRKKSLIKKREKILNRMRQMQSNSHEDSQVLETLLSDKMNIDFELNNL